MTGEQIVTLSKNEYESLILAKGELEVKVSYLEQQLAELKRLIFGTKSERHVPSDINQPTLFELPQQEAVEPVTQEITYQRGQKGKKQPIRTELPAHLPRVTEVIEPENLPVGAKRIDTLITEVLKYEPSRISVRQIIRYKYIIEQTDEKTTFLIAPLPTLPIPKGNADSCLISHVLVSKFVDHLPLHRQIKMFKRQGVTIAESTMNGWISNVIPVHLSRLYAQIKNTVLTGSYLMADETPIPVLSKDKPGSSHKGYLWAYYDPINKLVFFDYRKSRSRTGPEEVLKEYDGYLQTDGYTGYNGLNNGIIQLACMAHARRKFEYALENNKELASHALGLIRKLYDIERYLRDNESDFDTRKQIRQDKALPVLLEFKQWMDDNLMVVAPRSSIGLAIAYTLNLWPRLIRYIEDGRLEIDNNLIENSIRPIALGRKNYLFAGSHESAGHIAIMYSLLGTCKIRGIEPESWLKQALSIIPDTKDDQLKSLLPGELI
jgi:transposase